ncbi:MAG: ABC transporter substrate-binding protein, partial [Angelakisella sp.]
MKKVLSVLLAATMVAAMAGCSGGSTGTTPPAPAPSAAPEASAAPAADTYAVTEPIEIEFWHALETQYQPTVDKVVAEFEKQNPNIKVKAIYQGKYSELNEKLIAAQAAGTTLPAVTAANTPYVAEYGASGMCEVLDPYIAATGFEIDDFGKGLVASTQYDGQQVTLPFLISTQVMYYNKTMADAEGIKMPETIAEMDDFMKKASKVNNGVTERYATVIPGWDQWYFETFYLNQGVKLINEDGKSTDLDSEKAIGIANQFKKWCDDGVAYWAYGTDASNIMRQNFIDGKAFSVMHTSSLYNTYVDKCDFEVGMHYYPGDITRNSEVGGSVLLIPAKNDQKVKNAGWQFLSFLCSKDINMLWAKETGYMPTRNSVLETEEGKKFLEEKPAFKAIFDNLDSINPRIQHPAYSTFSKLWMESMGKSIIEKGDIPTDMKAVAKLMN